MEVQVAGRAGVPVDASTAVLTVAAVDPLASAFLTVYPTGSARPNASNVNYNAGANTANTVLARLEQEFFLGATDLRESLHTALEVFSGPPAKKRRRVVIYVGDGKESRFSPNAAAMTRLLEAKKCPCTKSNYQH